LEQWQWESEESFFGAWCKKKVSKKSGSPVTEAEFWSKLSGPFKAGDAKLC
jgi:hypothetical protein